MQHDRVAGADEALQGHADAAGAGAADQRSRFGVEDARNSTLDAVGRARSTETADNAVVAGFELELARNFSRDLFDQVELELDRLFKRHLSIRSHMTSH